METLTATDEKGVEVTLKFEKLTIDQEDEFADWLRLKLRRESVHDAAEMGLQGQAAADYVSSIAMKTGADQCSLTTELGLRTAMTSPAGLVKVLQLAARKHHPSPEVPEALLRQVVNEQRTQATLVVAMCLPVKSPELEKKVAGLRAGPS